VRVGLLIRVGEMQRLDPRQFSHTLNLFSLKIASLSLDLFLLLGQLLMHLKKRNLEQAVEPFLLKLRHGPLNDNVDLLFFVRGLHLKLCSHECLLHVKVVLFICVFEYRGDRLLSIGKKGLGFFLSALGRYDDEKLPLLIFFLKSPQLSLVDDLNRVDHGCLVNGSTRRIVIYYLNVEDVLICFLCTQVNMSLWSEGIKRLQIEHYAAESILGHLAGALTCAGFRLIVDDNLISDEELDLIGLHQTSTHF
jgi:hypothetical protein